LTDGTKVKNVVVLRLPTGSNVLGSKVFNNQFPPLNQIAANVDEGDVENGKVRLFKLRHH